MKRLLLHWIGRTLVTCALLMACSQSSGQTPDKEAAASTETGFAGLLSNYEAAREALAADRIADAVSIAKHIESSAKNAKASVAAAQQATMDALIKAAATLAQTSKDDESAVRRGFGEVSKQLVSILRAVPKYREGLYLFECPMAEGFKQWVARKDQVENPYMGTKMLHCGSKRTF